MAGVVSVEPGVLLGISRELVEPAEHVRRVARRLVGEAGPEVLSAALGNYVGQVNCKPASELPAAMKSVGTVIADGLAPALASIANVLDGQETVSAEALARTQEHVV